MTDTTLRDQLAELVLNRDEWDAADAILAAGWRPPARTVSTVEELDALAHMTVIRSALGTVMEKWQDGSWRPTGMHNIWPRVELPATVLWEPEDE